MEIEAFYDSANLFGRLAYSTMKGKRDQSPRDPWFGQKHGLQKFNRMHYMPPLE